MGKYTQADLKEALKKAMSDIYKEKAAYSDECDRRDRRQDEDEESRIWKDGYVFGLQWAINAVKEWTDYVRPETEQTEPPFDKAVAGSLLDASDRTLMEAMLCDMSIDQRTVERIKESQNLQKALRTIIGI